MITNSAIAKKGARNCRNHEHYVIIRRGNCCRNCVRSSTACCCKHGFFIPKKIILWRFTYLVARRTRAVQPRGNFDQKSGVGRIRPEFFHPRGENPHTLSDFHDICSLQVVVFFFVFPAANSSTVMGGCLPRVSS